MQIDTLSHLLDLLAFNYVERFSLEMQLASRLQEADEEEFVQVARMLTDKVSHLSHKSGYDAHTIMHGLSKASS